MLFDGTLDPDVDHDALALEDPTRPAIPIAIGSFEDRDPKMIYPGTDRVTVDLSWAEGSIVDPVGASPRVCVNLDETYPDRCGSGADRNHTFATGGETWTIPVNETTTDGGHARTSDWKFALEPCSASIAPGRCVPDDRSFRVRIAVHNDTGTIPIAPPHPDPWGDADSLILLGDVESGNALDLGAQAWYRNTFLEEARPLFTVGGDAVEADDNEVDIVPWGARRVNATLTWEATSSSDLDLRYRPPGTPPGTWYEASETAVACATPPSIGSHRLEAGCRSYAIPVSSTDSDGIYEDVTDWEFGIFREDAYPSPLVNYEVELTVTVHR